MEFREWIKEAQSENDEFMSPVDLACEAWKESRKGRVPLNKVLVALRRIETFVQLEKARKKIKAVVDE